MRLVVLIAGIAALSVKPAAAQDSRVDNWHHWRGPLANGTAPKADPPIRWDAKTNIRYVDGEMARNVTLGKKGGTCTARGDSGGPTYTVSGGKIVAKGIISAGGNFTDGDCMDVFTDIRLAEKAMPGIVKKG